MTPTNPKAEELLPVTLKPCPFCGGEAERRPFDYHHPDEVFGLVVNHAADCFLNFPLNEEALYSAWDHRIGSQAELVEALVEAKRELWMIARGQWTLADFKNWAVIQQIDAALNRARLQGPTA